MKKENDKRKSLLERWQSDLDSGEGFIIYRCHLCKYFIDYLHCEKYAEIPEDIRTMKKTCHLYED